MTPIFKPYMPELPELPNILHSGALAYGVHTREFEAKLRAYFGTPYLLVTNSFSSAIAVAITSLGLSFGDEVIASPMACLVSTQPYASNGLKIKWCDVDPQRGTLCPDYLSKMITPNTKAIIHNHFCGYPGYIDEVNAIGREYGIPVIDDGIECFGSLYRERLIGNCGTDVTVFSLGAVRNPNCIDGGIVIFKSQNLFEKAVLIRDCGIDRKRFRDSMGEISLDCDIELVGYSATMSDVNGYIGSVQMNYIDELLSASRKNAGKWNTSIEKYGPYKPISCAESNPNYWVYGILADNKVEAIKNFREQGYYASGVHAKNNVYSVFGETNKELQGVNEFYSKFVALPCGWWMA